ncbi:hypothetical protein EDB85DRAFT_1889630 [Lactarius pseudohatsudake]|nr:hypothetical protein EDB85DRAFT_1889630 [Lactarius pseudohatsudake]
MLLSPGNSDTHDLNRRDCQRLRRLREYEMRKHQGEHTKKTFRATRTPRTLRASLAARCARSETSSAGNDITVWASVAPPCATSSAENDSTVCVSVAPRYAPSERCSTERERTEVDGVQRMQHSLPGINDCMSDVVDTDATSDPSRECDLFIQMKDLHIASTCTP